jgi:hypothetical protein
VAANALTNKGTEVSGELELPAETVREMVLVPPTPLGKEILHWDVIYGEVVGGVELATLLTLMITVAVAPFPRFKGVGAGFPFEFTNPLDVRVIVTVAFPLEVIQPSALQFPIVLFEFT